MPRCGFIAWLVGCIALIAWPASPSRAGRADFVGAAACKDCHGEAYRIWQGSAHARAEERLAGRAPKRCAACHTTGDAPAGRPYFPGVQCEACHGGGAGYAADDIMRDLPLARRLGLRDLSSPEARRELCRGCHRQDTGLRPFDPDAAWQRIAH